MTFVSEFATSTSGQDITLYTVPTGYVFVPTQVLRPSTNDWCYMVRWATTYTGQFPTVWGIYLAWDVIHFKHTNWTQTWYIMGQLVASSYVESVSLMNVDVPNWTAALVYTVPTWKEFVVSYAQFPSTNASNYLDRWWVNYVCTPTKGKIYKAWDKIYAYHTVSYDNYATLFWETYSV